MNKSSNASSLICVVYFLLSHFTCLMCTTVSFYGRTLVQWTVTLRANRGQEVQSTHVTCRSNIVLSGPTLWTAPICSYGGNFLLIFDNGRTGCSQCTGTRSVCDIESHQHCSQLNFELFWRRNLIVINVTYIIQYKEYMVFLLPLYIRLLSSLSLARVYFNLSSSLLHFI